MYLESAGSEQKKFPEDQTNYRAQPVEGEQYGGLP